MVYRYFGFLPVIIIVMTPFPMTELCDINELDLICTSELWIKRLSHDNSGLSYYHICFKTGIYSSNIVEHIYLSQRGIQRCQCLR